MTIIFRFRFGVNFWVIPSKSISQTFNISINQVTVSPATSTICCYSQTLKASGASTYTWSPSYGLSATTGSSVIADPAVTTTYTAIGSPTNTCANTATAVVGGPCVVEAPGDTACDLDCFGAPCDITTDVSKMAIDSSTTTKTVITSEHLNIYPNPNNGSFILQIFTGSNITSTISIQLFNILGQMVYEQYSVATNGYLQQQLQPLVTDDGVYVISVSTGKSVFHQTVVISK